MSGKNRSALSAAAGHYHAGRLTEAEWLYRRVLDQYPDDVDAIQGLAALCYRRGRPDEALALFRRAITLDPDSPVGSRPRCWLPSPGSLCCWRRWEFTE